MKLLEIFRSDCNKFFSRNTICRTTKSGYVYVDEKKVFVPSETKLKIEYFDLYTNQVIVLIDGRQRAHVTYEYLMDCVTPITTDVSKVVDAVQVLQRVNHIVSNEMLVKMVCIALCFIVGLLVGKLL